MFEAMGETKVTGTKQQFAKQWGCDALTANCLLNLFLEKCVAVKKGKVATGGKGKPADVFEVSMFLTVNLAGKASPVAA